MSVKTSVGEFKEFYGDEDYWPVEELAHTRWHEEEVITVGEEEMDLDEVLELPAGTVIKVSGGVVYSDKWSREAAPSLETYFKRWRKERTLVTLVVTVDKKHEAGVSQLIRDLGGKVK